VCNLRKQMLAYCFVKNLVARTPLNVNAIAVNFDVSRQAISLHIRILKECGLIRIERQGRERLCSIRARKLNEVSRWLNNFHGLWEQRFHQLDTLLIKAETQ
jgi:DNA-binding transcriptional ArsR family regulator